MRLELGDRLDNVNFGPRAATTPTAPAKADHKAVLTVADDGSGNLLFAIPAITDPANTEPLIGLKAVLVPVAPGVTLPTDAAGFLALDAAANPRGAFDVTPAQFGTTVTLTKPEGVQLDADYTVQAIHVYEN